MNNPLTQLLETHRKGNRPAIHLGPFLPLARIRERGLSFNAVMTEARAMTAAALMSFEFGFESTVLPFDLNVEAEILGARVRYHQGFDGHPVYPTIAEKPSTIIDDIQIPDDPAKLGRMPIILESIRSIQAQNKGAVGVILPGPFTLAGQVTDMDGLYLMLLKKPQQARSFFERLTQLIQRLIDVYVREGVDFMLVVEGGGASISPQTFGELVLPYLRQLFKPRKVPRVAYLFGKSETMVEFMLACTPDGIILDNTIDIEAVKDRLPESMPIFGQCGRTDMLATSTPAQVTDEVHRYLDMGFTSVGPPADIYPPARIENIEAFVKALQDYQG